MLEDDATESVILDSIEIFHKNTKRLPKIYTDSLLVMLIAGFNIRFSVLEKKNLGAQFTIERIHDDPGTIFRIYMVVNKIQFRRKIELTKDIKFDEAKFMEFNLPGYDNTKIILDNLGGIHLENIESDGNLTLNTNGDCSLENIKVEGQVVIQKALKVKAKGRVLGNKGVICFADNLVNSGYIEGQYITICLKTHRFNVCEFDNYQGKILAEKQVLIFAKDIINLDGTITGEVVMLNGARCDNTSGVIFSKKITKLKLQEDLDNQRGIIESEDLVLIEIASGKIKTSESGKIICKNGVVRIRASRIETDETSTICGAKHTDILSRVMLKSSG